MITLWGDSYWASPAHAGYIAIILGEFVDADLMSVADGSASSAATLKMMADHPERLPGVAIFSMGRCNYDHGPTNVLADYERAVEMLGHDRFLVIPLTRTARRGTTGFERCEQINEALRGFAGDRYVDTQEHMISSGLKLAGIGPTRQDKRDMAGGIIPSSLRCDVVHLNEIGNRLAARFIADELIRRRWAPAKRALSAQL